MRTQLLLRLASFAVCFAACSGCGMITQMAYIIGGGPKVPAEYDGLERKRVAVVCIANSSSYGTGVAASLLGKAVEQYLSKHVKDIEIIPQNEIEHWRDTNDWDEFDFVEIGEGVKAEMVLAIDLEEFGLRDGQTMYKGRADVTTSVFDITEDGKLVFRRRLREFTFPVNGGQHTTDVTEGKFRGHFISILAEQLAHYFFDYEFRETIAKDTVLIGQ